MHQYTAEEHHNNVDSLFIWVFFGGGGGGVWGGLMPNEDFFSNYLCAWTVENFAHFKYVRIIQCGKWGLRHAGSFCVCVRCQVCALVGLKGVCIDKCINNTLCAHWLLVFKKKNSCCADRRLWKGVKNVDWMCTALIVKRSLKHGLDVYGTDCEKEWENMDWMCNCTFVHNCQSTVPWTKMTISCFALLIDNTSSFLQLTLVCELIRWYVQWCQGVRVLADSDTHHCNTSLFFMSDVCWVFSSCLCSRCLLLLVILRYTSDARQVRFRVCFMYVLLFNVAFGSRQLQLSVDEDWSV